MPTRAEQKQALRDERVEREEAERPTGQSATDPYPNRNPPFIKQFVITPQTVTVEYYIQGKPSEDRDAAVVTDRVTYEWIFHNEMNAALQDLTEVFRRKYVERAEELVELYRGETNG